jgi:hypothetical protein
MPRVAFNLSMETAKRIKEYALRETGNMKGLSKFGEEAIKEYMDRKEHK